MAKKTKSVGIPIPMTDKDYQAESDFGSLERAEEIRSTPSRFRAARMMGVKKLKATQRALRGTKGKGSVKIA